SAWAPPLRAAARHDVAMTPYDPELAGRAARLREARDREGLLAPAARHPQDAGVAYPTPWPHDTLRLEAAAPPYYETALAAGAPPERDRLGAFTGLGSTYRVLGRYDESLRVFDRALAEHPGDPALTAFRAITLHIAGRSGEAVGDLLKLLTRTSGDRGIAAY